MTSNSNQQTGKQVMNEGDVMPDDDKAERAIGMADRANCAYCDDHNPERTNENDEPGKGTWVHYNVHPPSEAQSENSEAQICLASAEIEKAWAKLSKQDAEMIP